MKEYRRITYFNLLTDGRLNIYLSDIDKQAKEIVPQLTEQMAEREGVTEQIKSTN